MATVQGAQLDRKKLMADPIMVTTICLLVVFLALFILYPLAILLVDSFLTESGPSLSIFERILSMASFKRAFVNTMEISIAAGLASTLVGLLFAYVEGRPSPQPARR